MPVGRAAVDAPLVTVVTRPLVAVARADVISARVAGVADGVRPIAPATTGTAGEIGSGSAPGPRSYARANVGGAAAWTTNPSAVTPSAPLCSVAGDVGNEEVRLPTLPASIPVRGRS